jgi:hypothetical protein
MCCDLRNGKSEDVWVAGASRTLHAAERTALRQRFDATVDQGARKTVLTDAQHGLSASSDERK